jgi:hypothetical protein
MPAAGADIVLIAGAVTFTGEWYWKKEIDWKVPLATVLLAAAFEGLAQVDPHGAVLLSLMVFAGAATTKFDGHSAVDMVTALIGGGKVKTSTTKNPKTGATTGTNSPTTAVQ